jgi:hypothetical protein
MISFFIFRRLIIVDWGRDMRTILQPIRICGWRWDRPMDPIKIGCTGSPTLRPRTCGRLVVSQPLGAPNQYRTPNLRSLWPCSNTRLISLKNTSNYRWIMSKTRLTRLISPRNTSNSRRIINNFAKCSWTWHHRVVIHVRPLFGRMVPRTTSLLLLLQLRHYANLIFFWKHIQFVMNII